MIHPYYKAPTLLTLYRTGHIKVLLLYLLTGAITSATDYLLFVLCFNFLQTDLLLATVVAYTGGLLVSYVQSRFLVFQNDAAGQKIATSVWRYGLVLLINLGITYGMLWAFEAWFGLTPLIGKFIVWTFLLFWNFILNKYWVFKGPRQVATNKLIWRR